MNSLYRLAWLEIVKAIPVDSTVPIASFTNAVQAIHHARTQDPLYQRLIVVTKDDVFFWVLPAELAQRLINRGFWPVPTQSSIPGFDILTESNVTLSALAAS
ncbi:hypothetical protein DYU11_17400 [Fibrisoma montanum]|uniref:Uncharacterized protein n=1 Tax=Fibrisoma montanum TaxID=2305895 RepID=A0A418M5R0_9BACT|nr:hypothetical protein [Fibrisoma montanum]RIV21202.1 hypothetical protein DYU11_17400 [Fibrisoma montanum]